MFCFREWTAFLSCTKLLLSRALRVSGLAILLSVLSFVSSADEEANTSEEPETPTRYISQSNLVYLQLDTGLVLIELAPFMAPNFVERFKVLVSDGYYDGLGFYRVIDGFVAQAGDLEEIKVHKLDRAVQDELSRPVTEQSDFYPVQAPDFFTDQTGFINGFAAGRDNTDQQEWLLHCYGAVALARKTEIDTGSSHFYINIGHSPRSLDRNLTVFGRVVYGMDKVQKINRPEFGSGGIIEDVSKRTKILSARLGNNVPSENQIQLVQVLITSDAAQKRLREVRSRSSEFFIHKGKGNVDACSFRLPIKLAETHA